VKQLLKLPQDDSFVDACKPLVKQAQNSWFDPIDPAVSISQAEICQMHKQLFNSLKLKGITATAEAIAFSYLTDLDLFANANEQEDYENAIELEVKQTPKQACLSVVTENYFFAMWDQNVKDQKCTEAA